MMIDFISRRFERDKEYLNSLIGSTQNMQGTIVVLDEIGMDNYTKKIKYPMDEETLIIGEDDNSVLLFFKRSDKKFKVQVPIEGVTVVRSIDYTRGCIIHKKQEPADVPNYLYQYIFNDDVVDTFSRMSLQDADFFDRNYKKGGMISLKEVRRHPEWKEEYNQKVEIKLVHICKSCGFKAFKGCCSDYSSSNRKKVKMVIGWS